MFLQIQIIYGCLSYSLIEYVRLFLQVCLDLRCKLFMEMIYLFSKFVKLRCKSSKCFVTGNVELAYIREKNAATWLCFEALPFILSIRAPFLKLAHLGFDAWSSSNSLLVTTFHMQGCNRQSECQENYKNTCSYLYKNNSSGFMGIFVGLRLSLFIRI